MTTINGMVHYWDRYRHRGTAELDDGKTVQINARDLGAARRRPEWQGPFELHPGDRVECVRDADGRITDILRRW